MGIEVRRTLHLRRRWFLARDVRETWFYLDAGCTVIYTLKKSTKDGALMIYECFSTTSTQVPGGCCCKDAIRHKTLGTSREGTVHNLENKI